MRETPNWDPGEFIPLQLRKIATDALADLYYGTCERDTRRFTRELAQLVYVATGKKLTLGLLEPNEPNRKGQEA